MPSANYRLIREAIENEQQIVCRYGGHLRELCPHILGHAGTQEKLLAWQFGGQTSSALPPGGEWRCFKVAEMRNIERRAGEWHSGGSHQTTQTCVPDVDIDVNIHVRRR